MGVTIDRECVCFLKMLSRVNVTECMNDQVVVTNKGALFRFFTFALQHYITLNLNEIKYTNVERKYYL